MGERLLGLASAAREPVERLGVEAFLAEAGEKRAQAGAREARVGVGRVVDERRAARIGEGDEVALPQGHQRPPDRHAVAHGHDIHAAQASDAGAAQQAKEHGLRLIVGVMGGEQRLGADRPRIVDEQTVARLARALLQARSRASRLSIEERDARP